MKHRKEQEWLPEAGERVLLHACCAPCSSAIVEHLVGKGIRPTIFYSNANITPKPEYDRRLNECIRYAEHWGLDIVDDTYDHKDWLCISRGLEKEPERGARCLECFRYRLTRAAEYASKNGFRYLATTLASSRWKDLEQVDEAGKWACALFPGVTWWDRNWRKGGLQERRNALIKEYGFYNQLFCGCEFSPRGESQRTSNEEVQ